MHTFDVQIPKIPWQFWGEGKLREWYFEKMARKHILGLCRGFWSVHPVPRTSVCTWQAGLLGKWTLTLKRRLFHPACQQSWTLGLDSQAPLRALAQDVAYLHNLQGHRYPPAKSYSICSPGTGTFWLLYYLFFILNNSRSNSVSRKRVHINMNFLVALVKYLVTTKTP